ncbi:Ssb Single-stranded DNA-binding protein [uncultured Caudovirales phage]|uniref:Single-stranded DNA-binding protein n=1 Tax=uncultured Caudovirales phage TaxID=2100421 RepID=A0A6J5Q8E3_9CAUD|nr:Ssb Single-stranded DNA-binding protein [uncultured Caudovirales phage]
MINSVVLMGGLTADPVFKEVGGNQICSFSIAVEEVRKEEKYVSYFECVLFGKSVNAFCQIMAKGRKAVVSGSLKQDRWKDKETGGNRSRVTVFVNQWQVAGSKPAAKPAEQQAESRSIADDVMPF